MKTTNHSESVNNFSLRDPARERHSELVCGAVARFANKHCVKHQLLLLLVTFSVQICLSLVTSVHQKVTIIQMVKYHVLHGILGSKKSWKQVRTRDTVKNLYWLDLCGVVHIAEFASASITFHQGIHCTGLQKFLETHFKAFLCVLLVLLKLKMYYSARTPASFPDNVLAQVWEHVALQMFFRLHLLAFLTSGHAGQF